MIPLDFSSNHTFKYSIIKKLFILTLLCTAISFCFSSCSKDEESLLDKRLVGTKWTTVDVVEGWFSGGTSYHTYEFTSASNGSIYTTKNGNVIETYGDFTYILTYPNIKITKTDGTILNYTFKDSRTMVVYNTTNEYGSYQKYVKQ